MGADAPSLELCVCTRDRLPWLREALPPLLAAARRRPGTVLRVVDNGSRDGTPAFLRHLSAEEPLLRVSEEHTPGVHHARARAVAESVAPFLLFVDDDVFVEPDFLAGLDDAFADPRVGVVGGAVEPGEDFIPPAWLPQRLVSLLPVLPRPARLVDCAYPCFPISACMAIRRHPCLDHFLAPERRLAGLGHGGGALSLGGEDTDLCEIYARAGLRVVLSPALRVRHPVHPDRLRPAWIIDRMGREGRLRVRLARLRGKPGLCAETATMLAALPMLAMLRCLAPALSAPRATWLRAYFAKSRGAWAELLRGPRGLVLPYPKCGTA